MRYKLTLCYDGGDFYGFQRQRGLISVQECLETALSTKLNMPISTVCAGRTDAGVHALGQVVHFDYDGELPADLGFRLNPLLPESIAVLSCERVPESFHARFSAKRKTYRYDICLSKLHAPLKRRYAHICVYDLNVENMKNACACLLGTHDFRSFALAESVRGKSTVRTIFDIHLQESEEGKMLSLFVTGDGFLHNMVRAIAGTLIDVGRGRFSPDDMKSILESKDRRRAGKTVEGCGLFLVNVEY